MALDRIVPSRHVAIEGIVRGEHPHVLLAAQVADFEEGLPHLDPEPFGLGRACNGAAVVVREHDHRHAGELRVEHALAGAVEELPSISEAIRNSVLGRRVEPQAALALVKRSPKIRANCALAMIHSRGPIFHAFSGRFKTR